jgi:hypothetical protein
LLQGLRSISVSKGRVIQSQHVILAVFSITFKFPGLDPGLHLVLPSRELFGLPPSLLSCCHLPSCGCGALSAVSFFNVFSRPVAAYPQSLPSCFFMGVLRSQYLKNLYLLFQLHDFVFKLLKRSGGVAAHLTASIVGRSTATQRSALSLAACLHR